MAYTDLSGYGTAQQTLLQQMQGMHSDSWQARDVMNKRLSDTADQFKTLFQNSVGRAATNDEINMFLQQNAGQTISNSNQHTGQSENDPTGVRNSLMNYIGDTYQQQAQDTATQKLQAQQGQANSLADLYRSQGNTAINSTEQSLLDYQSKLFDRLRPNLITSLQSQGLLNTGGMNEAIAGVQGDLANNASNYIAQLKLQNEQGANQIAFGGAAAPYQYQQQNIMQNPNMMYQQGQNALGFNNNTFMSNLDYSHQLGLSHQQAMDAMGQQPSFLKQMGLALAGDAKVAMSYSSGGGGGGAPSSARKFKKDITKLTEADEEAIYNQMVAMPLNRWRYKTEDSTSPRHLGVMTDEALPELVTEDGDHLSVVDYLGMITLAIKVQHRKMQEVK